MIGIERTEIDRSQVLRPAEGESFGMVLQVPYGPITPTYIDSEDLLLQYFAPGSLKPISTYKDYYESIVLLKQAPILACRPQGDAKYGGVTIERNITGNVVAGLTVGITDPTAYTFLSNEIQFAIIGAEPSTNNNNYSVEILTTTSTIANAFDIVLYYNAIEVTTFTVSLIRSQKDGFGNSIYIEDVIKNRSDIQVIVNSSATSLTTTPVKTIAPVSFLGGTNITTFSTSYTITAWDYFKQYNKYFTHYLVDCSCNEVIGKAVIDIAEANWYQMPFFGIPSVKSTNPNTIEDLNTWKTNAKAYRDINGIKLNVNTDHASLFGVWGRVNDTYNDTTVWISPVSTAAARKAFTLKNISISQSACGLNANRGAANDFIELEQDVQSIVDELDSVQINVLTYTPAGKCVWNENTLQTSLSNTSFISHRTFFNTLEENIETLLLSFVFTDINDTTMSELTSILNSYLIPMKGIHLEDVEVRCNNTNNPPALKNQRKMKVQVGVIPYPKAKKIIFEFIHSRSGVSLSEIF
jgi:hypothetical protein